MEKNWRVSMFIFKFNYDIERNCLIVQSLEHGKTFVYFVLTLSGMKIIIIPKIQELRVVCILSDWKCQFYGVYCYQCTNRVINVLPAYERYVDVSFGE